MRSYRGAMVNVTICCVAPKMALCIVGVHWRRRQGAKAARPPPLNSEKNIFRAIIM